MMPETKELEICFAFDAYCRRTLKNEAINAHKQINRQKERILNFSDLPIDLEYLIATDGSVINLTDHLIQGKCITNEQLTDAIHNLPEYMKRVITLYYFDELNDRSISQLIKVPRSTIQNWRASALEKLRSDLLEKQ